MSNGQTYLRPWPAVYSRPDEAVGVGEALYSRGDCSASSAIQCLVVSTTIPKVMFGSLTTTKRLWSKQQKNGIAERFVRTLKEWLEDKSWQSAEELGLLLDHFHTEYNDRPHQGLSIKGLSPNEFAKRL